MSATPLNSRAAGAMALACAIFGTTLMINGCGTPAGTAGAVAAAAASDIVAAATQPTTQSATVAASALNNSSSRTTQGLWGRWVRNGNVINPDGSYGSGQLCEWSFNRNGSFQNQARFGVANSTFMTGSFKVVGGVLTLSVGKTVQIYDYQIKGGKLLLTNPRTHETVILQRG